MPAKDIYHNLVVQLLIDEGWQITDDPLYLSYGGRDLFIDLGAEQNTIAAEKGDRKIAVEIKSFLKPSPVTDLGDALGQYGIYYSILAELQPERKLYLAVPQRAYKTILTEKLGQLIVKQWSLNLLVFDGEKRGNIQWIS
ncbi:XisH family protein [Roseofilum casamattae]|uniref:XisH family protein n=1 Tax=Roseofilum casamattae BLCC-M143 TaxID=3022442 RepID=A0ABT7C165_9CYAN|nr:XisH family protein [Roseofilum casamattae]MDJ1185170.1 XisH family protein [Roseofilum casamattae BLCC-M143]